MAKVYITQVPHRRDPETRAFVPSFNISPATEHGEIVVLMPPRTSFFDTEELSEQLWNHLKNYDEKAGDCLLIMGDPIIIAVAVALLAAELGTFTVLKWDRVLAQYLQSKIVV